MTFCGKQMLFKMSLILFSFLSISAASEKTDLMNKKVIKKKSDIHWSRLATIMRQVDAIDREAWWVVNQNRAPATKSVFGKIQRAAQSEDGQKLTQKQLFNCDRYSSQRKILNAAGFPQKISMFHVCRKDHEQFAEIDWTDKSHLTATFSPGPLTDVLGLNASILGKKIVCEIVTDDQAIVQNFSCKNMIKDRSATEVVELETYDFKKKDNSQLTLKGNVTEQMKIKSKIETHVPLSGKITVLETEVSPPPGYVRKATGDQPKAAAPSLAPVIPPPPPSELTHQNVQGNPPAGEGSVAPLNPDQLVKKVIEEEEQRLRQTPSPLGPHGLNPSQTPSLPEPDYIEDNNAAPQPSQQFPQVPEPSRR